MIGDVKPLARLPYILITPLFPLAGLVGLIPPPSKWHIEFGTPVPTCGFVASAVEEPMAIFDLTDHVRETIHQTVYRLPINRRQALRG